MSSAALSYEARLARLEARDEEHAARLEKIEAKIDRVLWGIAGLFGTVLIQMIFHGVKP